MIEFKSYITEATSSEEKLQHLEHAEDHPLNAGEAGFAHAKDTLTGVHHALQGKESNATITTKYDGSPSIVFGHHPETGKFFVASKSAFNVNPKINYTAKDIEENHGHAPGLVNKLKAALKHLPKVTPKSGVFQGDVMHSGVANETNPHGDVSVEGNKASFTPNTITYTTKDAKEAERINTSKIGVAVHTAYHGKNFKNLKAKYNIGQEGFKDHPDVHLIDTTHDVSTTTLTPEQSLSFNLHMKEAERQHKALSGKGYEAIADHTDHLKSFINKNVREEDLPTVEGYKQHVQGIYQRAADKLKTATGKAKQLTMGQQHVSHIEKNAKHFHNVLQMHKNLQTAKDELVQALSSKQKYAHTINGKAVKPEGFVAVINNRPTKLVDRAEFSRANFARQR